MALTPEQETAALQYDFDSDSKGDSGVLRRFSTKMVKAAKQHTCFPCFGPIVVGERHRVERVLDENHKVGNCRSCETCCAAMAASARGNWKTLEARYSLGRKRSEGLK